MVINLDEGGDGAVVDELDAEDVGIGEGGLDVGFEGWGFGLGQGFSVLLGCVVSLTRPRRSDKSDKASIGRRVSSIALNIPGQQRQRPG